jgi:hypothetical protein
LFFRVCENTESGFACQGFSAGTHSSPGLAGGGPHRMDMVNSTAGTEVGNGLKTAKRDCILADNFLSYRRWKWIDTAKSRSWMRSRRPSA